MSFYSDMSATVSELLTEFGMSATLTRQTGGTFDPTAGTVTGSSTVNYTVTVAQFDYDLKDSGADYQKETEIRSGDKQIFLAASGLAVVPVQSDTITVAGTTYNIANIKALSPAGVVVMYELHGRL